MSKSTHFIGQPLYSQVINLLDRTKILQISQQNGGERYTKSFNCWSYLVVMLYAVIMRFDSLREISASLLGEARKLRHWMPRRSTLADANKRCLEAIFETIYRTLYATYRSRLYEILEDIMYQTPDGFMEVRIQHVVFSKSLKLETQAFTRFNQNKIVKPKNRL